MKKISAWLYKISTGRITLLAILVFFVFMFTVLPGQAEKASQYSEQAGSIDTSFFYTPEDLYQTVEGYGPEGRQAYIRARWTFDLVFPLVYTFFLGTTISYIFTKTFKSGSRWLVLNLFPVLGMLLDFLENTFVTVVMVNFPGQLNIAAWLASVSTSLKWFFVNGSFIVLLVGLAAWLLNGVKKYRRAI